MRLESFSTSMACTNGHFSVYGSSIAVNLDRSTTWEWFDLGFRALGGWYSPAASKLALIGVTKGFPPAVESVLH